MLSFTPLLGARADGGASQSLLELDGGIKILIDVGWDSNFDVESLKAIEEQVSSLSLILLTHPTLDHLGAFAHLCKHIPQFKSIPVYATTPVVSLGRTLLQDLYASSLRAATVIPQAALAEASYSSSQTGQPPSILLQPPTADEIAGYFSLINQLRYSQPLQPIASPFSPSVDGLTITAYGAGHTLGGTIWHIQHGLDSIVYAVDWNQAKENTLSGAAWLGGAGGGAEILEPLRRPSALICGSKGVERLHIPGGRRKRDTDLLDAVEKTIANGGVVLIPTDSSARVLELAYILEQHWRRQLSGGGDIYKNARIHLASNTAGSTVRLARSMVEWMDEGLVRELEATNDARRNKKGVDDGGDQTPFDFKHVRLVERKARLQKILQSGRPGVILASDVSLTWGMSSDALQTLCGTERNLLVLTEHTCRPATSGQQGSSVERLVSQCMSAARQGSATIIRSNDKIAIKQLVTHELMGEELSVYQQYLARRRQVQSTQGEGFPSSINPAEAVADDQSSSSSEASDESDTEQQGRALTLSNAMNQNKRKVGLTDAELGVNILLRKKNVYDYDVRGKRGREKMFPFAIRRNRDDIYGEAIRPEDYLRAEERDEDAQVNANTQDATALGEKRKWDDSKTSDPRRSQREDRKRQRMNEEDERDRARQNGDINLIAADSDADSDFEPDDVTPTGPRKVTFTNIELELRLGMCFIDFSALAEKRDLQMLIPLIKPSKLVITGGTQTETESLAEDCRTLLGEEDGGAKIVLAPRTGETVDASVDTNSWSIKLTRSLVKQLTWQNVKGLGVVAVTARLGRNLSENQMSEAEEQRRKKLKLIKGEPDGAEDSKDDIPEPVLDVLPSTFAITTQQTTQPIHVGDLRLADLRRLMQASGHVAEFRGEGTLLVDGSIIVRKTAGGQIDVEGGAYIQPGTRYDPTDSFVDVRRMIYEGLAVVAGG